MELDRETNLGALWQTFVRLVPDLRPVLGPKVLCTAAQWVGR